MRKLKLGAAAVAVVLGTAVLACGRSPRETVQQAGSEAENAHEALLRLQVEQMLCLDGMSLEEVIAQTGSAAPCEWVEEWGDSSFGVVRFVGQIHPGDREASQTEDETMVLSQLTILKLLLARGARTVFWEGEFGAELKAMTDARAAFLARSFANAEKIDSVGQLDTHQFLMLRRGYLPLVFKALRPAARVFSADDTTALRRLDQEEDRLDWWEADSLRGEHRERFAMETICRYLSSHRSETVYLVFGAAHIIDSTIVPAGLPKPRIHCTLFPGLMAAEPVFQPMFTHYLRATPGFVTRYLDRLGYLDPECFDELDESQQLYALKKPFLLTADVPDPDSLDRYLVRTAKSERVRRMIERGPIALMPRD